MDGARVIPLFRFRKVFTFSRIVGGNSTAEFRVKRSDGPGDGGVSVFFDGDEIEGVTFDASADRDGWVHRALLSGLRAIGAYDGWTSGRSLGLGGAPTIPILIEDRLFTPRGIPLPFVVTTETVRGLADRADEIREHVRIHTVGGTGGVRLLKVSRSPSFVQVRICVIDEHVDVTLKESRSAGRDGQLGLAWYAHFSHRHLEAIRSDDLGDLMEQVLRKLDYWPEERGLEAWWASVADRPDEVLFDEQVLELPRMLGGRNPWILPDDELAALLSE